MIRSHSPACMRCGRRQALTVWYRTGGGLVVCPRCRPDNLLDVECPYTSCSSPVGIPCRNAVTGGELELGHRERRAAAKRARAEA